MDLDARLAALALHWARDAEVAAVYLFGSRARGAASVRSDVDLAVVLAAGLDAERRWRKRLDLITEATGMLGTDAVDLLVLEDAAIPVAHRVLRDGHLLAERDAARRTQVAEYVMRRYLDEEYLRRELDRGLSDRLREGRFAR